MNNNTTEIIQKQMDLTQTKLSKNEWENIEKPVSSEEKTILDLIKTGFHDISHKFNDNLSIFNIVKMDVNEENEKYIYSKYFKPIVDKISESYKDHESIIEFNNLMKTKSKIKIKRADEIRFTNLDSSLSELKKKIYEFTMLKICEQLVKYKTKKQNKWMSSYYTLHFMVNTSVRNVNTYVKKFIEVILSIENGDLDYSNFIKNGSNYIEKNKNLLLYADKELYEHQKKLFAYCKRPNPKLILYTAPTGTGKTLSPIGLSEKYRILFVCAARHVGLALAKSAISCDKKVAFGFGCNGPDDIRLHYSAAKDFVKNRKTGGIFRVDNSVGDNVEIMICDIKSFQPCMYYMSAFNDVKDMILYWDEPTITLDYESHELHETIKSNWENNKIPNVVLSSATLPQEDLIRPITQMFKVKFSQNSEIHNIISHDTKKSISIINKEGFADVPHYLFEDFKNFKESIRYCMKHKTILRYLDFSEICKFITFVNMNNLIKPQFKIDNYFEDISNISLSSVKEYYMFIASKLDEKDWNNIYGEFQKRRKQNIESSIYITTKDSHTLTEGPTIYLVEDVKKIAKFCIQSSKIPSEVLKDMMTDIANNNELLEQILEKEKKIEDALTRCGDIDKEHKMSNDKRIDPEIKTMMSDVKNLKKRIVSVNLNNIFVPNKLEHLEKWSQIEGNKSAFTSDIDEKTVERIMLLHDVEDSWKILLLMGIGVFTDHKNKDYVEIMKDLAEKQKLYLIIASSDYIYGTNYQFCHGYIGKDLEEMTQEKIIQAFGRIGRGNVQHNYSVRLRENSISKKVFTEEKDKIEVRNMNRLFA